MIPNKVKTRRKYKRYVYERDGGKCQRCNINIDMRDAIFHHIKHKSNGGSDKPENLLLTCEPCEKKYHSNIFNEFFDGA